MFKGRKTEGKKPLIDFNDYRQTVFVSGVGRSGTTWVANIINYANDYRFMFEPFHPQRVDVVRFRSGEIHSAFYKNICTKPEQEIDNISRFLGKPYEQKAFDAVGVPSTLCRTESLIPSSNSLIENFKNHITDKQIKKAVEILGLFGLNRIYSEDSMPLVSGGEQNLFTG